MTEETKKNFSIIENLVCKHFGLSEESKKIFIENLYNPFMDDEAYSGFDEDFRKTIHIEKDKMEFADKGWEKFKLHLELFVEENNITYENFKNNSFIKDKNVLKLFKYVKSFLSEDYGKKGAYSKQFYKIRYNSLGGYNSLDGYESNGSYDFDLGVSRFLESIGTTKVPSIENLKIVISRNFADWFLCSTSESWSSCLDLESSYDCCYWTGIPGLIVDKNRSLLYLADESKKKYSDIEVSKMISRSWIMLDKYSKPKYLRFYPSEIIGGDSIPLLMGNSFFSETKKSDGNFVSKYDIDLLRWEDGQTSFIFQDGTKFSKKLGKVFFIGSGGGYSGFDSENNIVDDNDLCCGVCLSKLIDSKESIMNYKEKTEICYSCGDRVNSDEIYYYNGSSYCESCFYDTFFVCEECGRTFLSDEDFGENLCKACHGKIYTECNICGEFVEKADAFEVENGKKVCEDCFYNNFFTCEECGENFKDTEKFGDNLCETCHKEAEEKRRKKKEEVVV